MNARDWIDAIGLSVLGWIIFCYSVWVSNFAERHWMFDAIGLPVFVGENVIAVCILLAIGKYFLTPKDQRSIQPWLIFSAVYFLIVLIKAIKGYQEYGLLSCRNAALFYYPICLLFGFNFYNPKFFNVWTGIAVLGIIVWAMVLGAGAGYLMVPFLLFYVAILTKLPRLPKIIGFFVMPFVFDYHAIYSGSRSHLMGLVAAGIVLIAYFSLFHFRLNRAWKLVIAFVLAAFFFVSIIRYADKNGLQTLAKPAEVVRVYKETQALIEQRRLTYQHSMLPIKLFKVNDPYKTVASAAAPVETKVEDAGRATEEHKTADAQSIADEPSWKISAPDDDFGKMQEREELQALFLGKANLETRALVDIEIVDKTATMSDQRTSTNALPEARSLESAYNNIIFRLLIWSDMLKEWNEKKPFWGISFGKPQRSESIEILNWAVIEWGETGWITPHNSFLHYFYRGGFFGLTIVLLLIYVFIHLLRRFFKTRSASGVLLLSGVVYLAMVANFLVVLELPYLAIPFWTFLGFTLAFCRDLPDADENTSRS